MAYPKYILSIILLFLWTIPLYACPPPMPGDTSMHPMAINSRIGLGMIFVSLFFVILLIWKNWNQASNWVERFKYTLILFFHPFWWISIYIGDCGHLMRNMSIVYTLALAGLLDFFE